MSLLLAAALLLSTPPPPATAQALDTYVTQLAAVEKSRTPVSLEPLFAAADTVQTQLMVIDPARQQAFLEQLSEADFAALQKALPGLLLNRGVDIYAQPDPAFFVNLAHRHGRPADIAFFTAYRQHIAPPALAPSYLDLNRRSRPCVRFGEGPLQEEYALWTGFLAAHPAAYTDYARQSADDIVEAVTLGTCACEQADSVIQEQRSFLARFPQVPDADKIRQRLAQIERDPNELPVVCR